MTDYHGENKPIDPNTPASQSVGPQFVDFFGHDKHDGGVAANRYFHNLTRAELWTGIQKLRYGKDGTWNGMNADQMDFAMMGCKTSLAGPWAEDSNHPRMAKVTKYSIARQDGEEYYECHRKILRFMVCSMDLLDRVLMFIVSVFHVSSVETKTLDKSFF